MCCPHNKRAPRRYAVGGALFLSRKAEPMLTPGTASVPDLRGKVRAKDPNPSWIAAVQIDRQGQLVLRSAVEHMLREFGPLTHDEVANLYTAMGGKRTPARVRHVVKEFVDDGRVAAADEKGRSNRNGPATRWQWVGE